MIWEGLLGVLLNVFLYIVYRSLQGPEASGYGRTTKNSSTVLGTTPGQLTKPSSHYHSQQKGPSTRALPTQTNLQQRSSYSPIQTTSATRPIIPSLSGVMDKVASPAQQSLQALNKTAPRQP
jgi:hypothetical protein